MTAFQLDRIQLHNKSYPAPPPYPFMEQVCTELFDKQK